MMRSRSRWKAGRTSCSGSGRSRPRESALLAACGARISRSRASSCSRNVMARKHENTKTRNALCTGDVAEKTRAVRKPADAEQLRQRLTEIRKRRAGAEIDIRAHMRAGREQRHVLPRVIGARRRGIVAVIGGDHQEIVVSQRRQHSGEPRVAYAEGRRV